MQALRERLLSLQDKKYQKFHSDLCPGTTNIIGIRIPVLRQLASEIVRQGEYPDYLQQALQKPFHYSEEATLCGMVLGLLKIDFTKLLEYLKLFVPRIDNWAVCDVTCSSLKAFRKNQQQGRRFLQHYLDSHNEYELRFAVVMLMNYYNDDAYIDDTLKELNAVRHEGYYVKMAVAWALSLCFIKHRDKTMKLFQNNTLDDFTYNKALQKCRESFRVSDGDKALLQSMKRK
ncbi:DNA alkylation repair protein [Phascolarctobacterium sp.]